MNVTRTILKQDNNDRSEKKNEIIVKYVEFLYDETRQCCD